MKTFISKGVTKLVIDLHNNDGMPSVNPDTCSRKQTIKRWISLPRSLFVQVPCQQKHKILVRNQPFYVKWHFNSFTRGFEATIRANELAKKIVASNIKLGLNSSQTFFAPDNCGCLNNTLGGDSVHVFIPRDIPQRHPSTCQLQLH